MNERDPLLVSTSPNAVPATRTTDALGRPDPTAGPGAVVAPVQPDHPTPVGGVVVAPPPRGRVPSGPGADGRRQRRWLKRSLLTLLVLVLAGVGWFGINLYQV
ncbi:MAG: hypothetical protein JWM12_4027, partial [Ilumatobacteraceae bacterium]|nr:hypothetical protein [Ilumatobacteraceae bacterium]